ncbi:hypothetical protein CR162_20220 [Pseudoroseomonas rhizosphaerae]|uniref:ATP synthase F0 subunit B n=1 Tax=Teichococcus rhizosphaerae TaxID=1335062 RepID=A0A2C6Z3M8_9PROT|nr:hypothetical protein [Pseudoroseomonas rhizosphaerae]PHK93121.1 hypothetical protein CR162_20220 [Pseudoroseomonas rhizosphaerae]
MSGHYPDPPSPSTPVGGARPLGATGSGFKDKESEAMPDIRKDAREAAASLAEEARQKKESITEAVTERAQAVAEQGKAAGAEQAEGLAHAVRRVADDLEDSSPQIARHVRAAAESVEGISAALRERSVGELMGEINGFARRQPVAFFGAAVLAGFAVTRFARSGMPGGHPAGAAPVSGSAGTTYSPRPAYQGGAGMSGTGTASGGSNGAGSSTGAGGSTGPSSGAGPAPGWVNDPASPGSTPMPMTMPAATLGGAAAHRPDAAQPGSMPRSDEVTS